MDAHESLLSTPEVARRLGVQPQTLRVWRSRAKGPRFVRLGDDTFSRVAYREADVLTWLENRTVDPGRRGAA
ncbi:MAG: helix-turn-helix domain-containing protein [Acidobacteriota bacterium]|jgi:predicted DNA-binding transcriptional regulator AlpA